MSEPERERPHGHIPLPGRIAAILVGVAVAVGLIAYWVLAPGGPGPVQAPAGPSVAAPGSGTPDSAAGGGAPQALRIGAENPREINRFETRVAHALGATAPPTTRLRRGVRVRATALLWRDREGRPFLRIPTTTALLNPQAFQRGRFELDGVVVDQPEVLAVQPATGAPWSFVPVLGLDLPPGPLPAPAPADRGVFLETVTVRGGHVELRFPDRTYVLPGLDAALPEVAVPAGGRPATVQIARATARFTIPADSINMPLQVDGATLTLPGGHLEYDVERLRLGESVAAGIRGIWDSDLPGFGFRAVGRSGSVRLADLRFANPRLPEEGVVRFGWEVEPRPAGTFVRLSDLELESGRTHVSGSVALLVSDTLSFRLESADLRLQPLTVDFAQRFLTRPLPYSGDVEGTLQGSGGRLAFDLQADLTAGADREPFQGHLAGEVALEEGGGARIRRASVTLQRLPLSSLSEFLPNLPLSGPLSGTLTLNGPRSAAPLQLDVHLDVAGGGVALTGTVDLTGREPRYDLQGRLIAVDLQKLLRPRFPPVSVTAQFTLAGRGLDPATADATLALDGRFHGWYTGRDDRVTARATARDGVLRVQDASAALGPVAATLDGEWSLREGAVSSGLDYRLRVATLAPLAPYLPGIGTPSAGGALDLVGRATGSLAAPAAQGRLHLQDVRYGEWSVGAAEASYQVVLGDSLPTVHVELGGRGIETPVAGAFEAVSGSFGMTPPTFAVRFDADRVGAGHVQVQADGRILADGWRSVTMRSLLVDLGAQRWALQQPAELRWGGDGDVAVAGFRLSAADGAGHLTLDGTLLPLARAAVRFDIAALPVAEVERLIGRDSVATGLAWASGEIHGGEAPVLDATFRLEQGSIQGIGVPRLEGSFRYAGGRAVAEASGSLEPGGTVRLNATLPLSVVLRENPEVHWIRDGALDGTLRTTGLQLSMLTPLLPSVRSLEGVASADISISGTPASPRFQGTLDLENGAATLPALDRTFTDIHGRLLLANETITVDSVQARSDGVATLTGAIQFEELTRPVADLELTLSRFRPMGGVRSLEPAAAWGTVAIRGPIPDVALSGQVRLDDGNVRVPEFGADPFQEEVQQFLETGGMVTSGLGATKERGLYERLSIQGLTLVAGDNLWFILQDARAQLGGELTLFKSGDEVKIFGTLAGEHGTFTMAAGPVVRRFQIESAEIRFFGSPEPNPGLQITASRTVYASPNEPIDVLVNVTGTARHPSLSLSTPGGVQFQESELLSFLLFGQSSSALGTGIGGAGGVGQTLLGGTIVGGATDILSNLFERAIVEGAGLPIDYLQVRSAANNPEDLQSLISEATLVFGKELGSDVFLTVDAGIGGLFGATGNNGVGLSVQWRIDPEWTLDFASEPLIRRRFNRLGIEIVSPLTNPDRQYTVDLRRRWSY